MKRLIIGLLILTACESDLDKLKRLDGERSIACLNAEIDQRVYTEERHPGGISRENSMKPATPVAESLGRIWSTSQAECELLTRKYNAIGR